MKQSGNSDVFSHYPVSTTTPPPQKFHKSKLEKKQIGLILYNVEGSKCNKITGKYARNDFVDAKIFEKVHGIKHISEVLAACCS